MRILHLTDRASARGGADWHLLGVIAALAERGHRQLLWVGRADGSADPACEVAIVPGLDAALDEGPLALDASAFRPHVIHLHNALRPAAMAWAAERDAVATVQDHRSFCPGRGKLTLAGERCREPMRPELCAGCFDEPAYATRIARVTAARLSALRRMRAVTVLSGYMRSELGALGVRAEVVPPFVHGLDRDAAPSGEPCVLFAGRLVEAKGARDAVAAWRRSKIALPLCLAGSGTLRAELEREPGVEVVGWLPHEAMSGVYRRARALVMPSRWQEPFGIAGLEALWMGVPVAAYDAGGISEWHPGGELLVPWGDVDALARALALAIESPAPATCGFEREPLVDRLENVYATVSAA